MAFAFVQKKTSQSSSGSPAVTLDAAPTVNNLLVASIQSQDTGTPTISGWSNGTNQSTGTGGTKRCFRMFYKISDGTETTITGSSPAIGTIMIVCEYSGNATTNVLDIENSQANASNTVQSAPSVGPTASVNRLIVGAAEARRTVTTWSLWKIGGSTTGVTERANDGFSSTSGSMWDLDVASTSGNYDASVTIDTGSVGAAGIMIFKPLVVTIGLPELIMPPMGSMGY